MKACEQYIDLMMRSIDRETTPQEEAELQAHLAQCEACRALYETYRAIDAGILAAEEEPPETLTAAVMNSIRAEQRQRNPKHLLRRFRFTAIAAVAAVLVLVFARFQPDAASVTENTMSAARSADAAVPQMEAEYQAPAEVPAAFAPALETQAEMDEPAEEAVAEECAPEAAEVPMTPMEDYAGTVAAKDSTGNSDLSEQAEALRSLGLGGDILLVSGVSEDEISERFPEATPISLETGRVAYEVTAEAAEAAVAAGELTVSAHFEDVSDGERCYLILDD